MKRFVDDEEARLMAELVLMLLGIAAATLTAPLWVPVYLVRGMWLLWKERD
jgi:hypothetical protein